MIKDLATRNSEERSLINQLRSKLVRLVFTAQFSPDGSMKNLSKTFPQFLGENANAGFIKASTPQVSKSALKGPKGASYF
jgi:hypothetical protein